MNFRTVKIFSLGFILCSVLLSNCYGTAPVYGPAPTKTPSLTPVLTSTTVVQEGNDTEIIQIGNIDQLGIIDQWGLGYTYDVALSPDEETLAVATPSGVFLYDLNTMEQERFIKKPDYIRLRQDYYPSRAVAFSPDGSKLAVAYDGIMIWDLKHNNYYQWIYNRIADFSIGDVAFSPEGDRIVVGSGGGYIPCDALGGNFALYDINSGAILYNDYFCPGTTNYFTFTNNGNIVLTGLFDNDSLSLATKTSIIETKTGELVKELSFSAHTVSVSPDGSKIALSAFKNAVKTEILDVNSEQVIDEVDEIVIFLPDGNQLIADDDSWQITTSDHQTVCTFESNPQLTFSVYRSPFTLAENKLLFRNNEGNIEIWDTSNCQLFNEYIIPKDIIYSLKFNAGGTLMALGDTDYLYLKDASTGENKFSISGDEAYSSDRHYDLSADGKTMVTIRQTASYTEEISLWNIASGEKVKMIPVSLNQVRRIALNSDGSIVAVMDYDVVYLWDAESGELLSTISGRSDGLFFNPSGGNFVLVEGSKVVFRNDHSGEIESSFSVGKMWFDIVFANDWRSFAVIKDDKIYLWDVEGNKIGVFKDYPPVITNTDFTKNADYDNVKFSPDNRLLVAIRSDSNGNRLRFWDTATRKIIRDIEIPYEISKLEFSPDGERLFLLGSGVVYIYAVVEEE